MGDGGVDVDGPFRLPGGAAREMQQRHVLGAGGGDLELIGPGCHEVIEVENIVVEFGPADHDDVSKAGHLGPDLGDLGRVESSGGDEDGSLADVDPLLDGLGPKGREEGSHDTPVLEGAERGDVERGDATAENEHSVAPGRPRAAPTRRRTDSSAFVSSAIVNSAQVPVFASHRMASRPARPPCPCRSTASWAILSRPPGRPSNPAGRRPKRTPHGPGRSRGGSGPRPTRLASRSVGTPWVHLRVHHHNYWPRLGRGPKSILCGRREGWRLDPAGSWVRRYCGIVPGPPDIRFVLPPTTDRALLERSSPLLEEAGEYNTFETDAGYLARPVEVQRFVIEHADGAPIGDLSYFGVTYGPNSASTAWKIGITVLRSQRRKGFGWRAQRLLAEHLFATTGRPSSRSGHRHHERGRAACVGAGRISAGRAFCGAPSTGPVSGTIWSSTRILAAGDRGRCRCRIGANSVGYPCLRATKMEEPMMKTWKLLALLAALTMVLAACGTEIRNRDRNRPVPTPGERELGIAGPRG